MGRCESLLAGCHGIFGLRNLNNFAGFGFALSFLGFRFFGLLFLKPFALSGGLFGFGTALFG